ncbi:hypothetical protein E2C01_002642 [Portunus trituberculatus]|uniref:Uncharacterized protein n=1 Tax=Portunus trituberculatus TaxID=210409 RepID=A0A5B7CKA5_PORTR|nr:hypothetical protein [Portunus trituberculatus]
MTAINLCVYFDRSHAQLLILEHNTSARPLIHLAGGLDGPLLLPRPHDGEARPPAVWGSRPPRRDVPSPSHLDPEILLLMDEAKAPPPLPVRGVDRIVRGREGRRGARGGGSRGQARSRTTCR